MLANAIRWVAAQNRPLCHRDGEHVSDRLDHDVGLEDVGLEVKLRDWILREAICYGLQWRLPTNRSKITVFPTTMVEAEADFVWRPRR